MGLLDTLLQAALPMGDWSRTKENWQEAREASIQPGIATDWLRSQGVNPTMAGVYGAVPDTALAALREGSGVVGGVLGALGDITAPIQGGNNADRMVRDLSAMVLEDPLFGARATTGAMHPNTPGMGDVRMGTRMAAGAVADRLNQPGPMPATGSNFGNMAAPKLNQKYIDSVVQSLPNNPIMQNELLTEHIKEAGVAVDDIGDPKAWLAKIGMAPAEIKPSPATESLLEKATSAAKVDDDVVDITAEMAGTDLDLDFEPLDDFVIDPMPASKSKPEPKPAQPTWQQIYDHKLEQYKQQYLDEGDPDGPKSVEDVVEKLKNDPHFMQSLIDSEMEHYQQDWLPEQLSEDFVKLKDMDPEEVLDHILSFNPKLVGEELGLVDMPPAFNKADYWFSPDPDQLSFPGIPDMDPGPTKAGQDFLGAIQDSFAEYYFDADDVISSATNEFGFFEDGDYSVTEALSDHYGIPEMAKESAYLSFDDMDEDGIMSQAGVTQEDLDANSMAYDAKYGDLDDSDIIYDMGLHGFDDDFDAFLPDDLDPEDVAPGFTFNGISSGGKRSSDAVRTWMDNPAQLQALLDAADAAPGSADHRTLLDFALPHTNDLPGNEQKVFKDTTRSLMDRIGNLEAAEMQGYDLDMPIFHGGKQRFDSTRISNRGSIYAATTPTGSRQGAYGKGAPYSHPMVFRGNIFGRGEIPDDLRDSLLENLQANAASEGIAKPQRSVVQKTIMEWSEKRGDALSEDEAQRVGDQLLTTYFSDADEAPNPGHNAPKGQLAYRDPDARKKAFSRGQRLPGNVPGWSHVESGSYGANQGAYQRGMMKLGFDAVPVSDEVDKMERSFSIFRPEMLRHPLAKFDPDRMKTANLFASPAAAGLMGYMALQAADKDNRDKRRAQQLDLLGGNI